MQRPSISVVLALHWQPSLERPAAEEIVSHFLSRCVEILKNPQARLTLYLSGTWLQLARQRKGSLLKELRVATEEGRVEWLGGGWHDPLMPFVPKPMRELEIRMHRQALEELTGARPRGFWLPSGIWENSLLSVLVEQGFEYTLLHDDQIEEATWRCTDRYGYRTLEDGGRILRVVQMDRALEEALVADDPDAFDAALRSTQTDADDDGYVLAALPMMYRKRGVYEREWFDALARMFELRSASSPRQALFKLASAQIDERRSAGGMNLVSALDAGFGIGEAARSCRDLLLMQPESNELQKRVLHLWRQISRLPSGKDRQNLAEKLLPLSGAYWYRNGAECGGIRFLEDRALCRRILMEVEGLLRRARKVDGPSLEVADVLGNGDDQLYCSSDSFSFLVEPGFGGRLRSLEHRPRGLSLVNGFHPARLEGDVGLHYAVDPVCAARDWFAPRDFGTAEEWLAFLGDNSGLLQGAMSHQIRMRRDGAQIVLSGDQWCRCGDRRRLLHVEKVLGVKGEDDPLAIAVQVTNPDFYLLQGCLATEMNFSFSRWAPERQELSVSGKRKLPLDGASLVDDVEWVEYADLDEKSRVVWSFVKPCRLLAFPMSTPAGENSRVQCLKLFAIWDLELMGQGKTVATSAIRVKKTGLL